VFHVFLLFLLVFPVVTLSALQLLCRLRDICLREAGFYDIFRKIKDEENAKAIKLLEHVVDTADAIKDDGERIEHLVKGVFSGNIFDLGAAQVSSTPCCLVSG
jgi:uncharacterized protein with ATP-grasp and redox domains